MDVRRRWIRLAVALALVGVGCAAPSGAAADPGPQEPPRLVVLLVVDQLPAWLFDHLDPAFRGGFRRLRDGGLRFTGATHDHAVTETAPGHATLATGTEPRKHGVPANDWWQRMGGEETHVLNVVDPDTPLLGAPGLPGASPDVLRRTGLADWLRDAHADARIVAVSGKDRGAVLLGGKAPGHVYWFDEGVGRFVTSTFYRDAYPEWVDRFNTRLLPGLSTDSVWDVAVPDDHRALARPDPFPTEGDGVHTTFPHEAEAGSSYAVWWAATPGVDVATLALAGRAMAAEALGRDDIPDLLAVSLSATDRIGHAYGPGSLEQLDNLWRLDRALGAFLDMVDREVGLDRTVVVLTSDHGAMDLPEAAAAAGRPGVRLTRDSVTPLQRVLDRASGATSDPASLAAALTKDLPSVSWIDRAWLRSALAGAAPPVADTFARIQWNTYVADRPAGLLSRAGVELQLAEGVVTWSYPLGAAHGTPWLYDRHVPLVLAFGGLPAGVRPEAVSAADVAPTLAGLLGVAAPDDLDGRDLLGGR